MINNSDFKYKKDELISEILKADNGFESEESERVKIDESVENDSKTNTKTVCGLIDITADGYGFLRSNFSAVALIAAASTFFKFLPCLASTDTG